MDFPTVSAATFPNFWNTATPPISLDTFLRQLSAAPHINMEKFGVDFGNDNPLKAAKAALNSREDKFVEREHELGKLNETIYQMLKVATTSYTDEAHSFLNGASVTLSIRCVSGKTELRMGNKSVLIPLSPAEIMTKLESQTVGRTFSKAIPDGSELKHNPARVIDVLAKYRTVSGERIVTQRKMGVPGSWVLPTVRQLTFPGSDESVSVHIGNNYIASANKLDFVDDAATVAFVDDMHVMTVVDGWGPLAKHECSEVHSALISAAALRTVQEFRDGVISEKELDLHFQMHMIKFYSVVEMPKGDTGVTFAGGVTYLDKKSGELKLFSYGFSSAMFVTVNENGSNTPHHVQKETNRKPYVTKGDYADLKKFSTKANITTVDKNAKEFKAGSDGCFSEFCNDIPEDFDKNALLIDLTCTTFPPHGEISPNLCNETRLRENFDANCSKSKKVDDLLTRAMATPKRIAYAMDVEGSAFGKDEFWQALNDKPWPDSLKKPSVTTVQQTIQGLVDIENITLAIKEGTLKKDTPISNFFELVSNDGKQEWRLRHDVESNPAIKALCYTMVKITGNHPQLIDALGEHTVEDMHKHTEKLLMKPVSVWSAMLEAAGDSDTEWQDLALDEDNERCSRYFEKPSPNDFARWQTKSNEVRKYKNYLEVNRKQLAGDDIIFVSVKIKAVREELLRRQQPTAKETANFNWFNS